jgi:hypothetical protein
MIHSSTENFQPEPLPNSEPEADNMHVSQSIANARVIGSALRYNSNKLRWSLVDFDALEDMVKVLVFGSKKYADNNWKKGLKTTEIFESIMRHLSAYMRGEEFDLESGLPHTGHILCNAMFLSYMEKYKKDFDTRFFDKNKKKCCGNWDSDGNCKCP